MFERTLSRWDVVLFGMLGAVAYGLKRHYSTASAEDLAWILVPTTRLVEGMTGLHFTAERYAGFVNADASFVIAPVCAGVNFLIVAFAALVLGFVGECSGPRKKAAWFVGSAALAYACTVIVNAVRIAAALRLRQEGGWIGSSEVHRVEGVVVYLVALWLINAVATRAFAARGAPALIPGRS
jgi:exosortase K